VGEPLVSIAVATNILAALTGSASGGLTIALDALGSTYLMRAQETGLDPALLHRVAVIGAGTLDSLPHNGAVVTLLSVCGSTHGESYRDIVVVGIIGAILALIAVIVLGTGHSDTSFEREACAGRRWIQRPACANIKRGLYLGCRPGPLSGWRQIGNIDQL